TLFTYILGTVYLDWPRWCFGIGPQGIGIVGMLLNFAVALALTPFCRPPSAAVRAMVAAIREPEDAGPAVRIEDAPEH
ncbi:MAG: cation acetate symporter, partial [Planctomycetes bacterium]|nr:cation acetate symporter [Planctomycetota bacterium]